MQKIIELKQIMKVEELMSYENLPIKFYNLVYPRTLAFFYMLGKKRPRFFVISHWLPFMQKIAASRVYNFFSIVGRAFFAWPISTSGAYRPTIKKGL